MSFKSFDDSRRQIQTILQEAGFYRGRIDGDLGLQSERAYNLLDVANDTPEQPGEHRGKGSSFADPKDIAAFKRCKTRGTSDIQCFKVGDNGIGLWGDDTTVDIPMCALPRDIWNNVSNPRGKKVKVVYVNLSGETKEVICELRDTMPHTRNIRNGAAIDLNPSAVRALGLTPPIMINVTWQWV